MCLCASLRCVSHVFPPWNNVRHLLACPHCCVQLCFRRAFCYDGLSLSSKLQHVSSPEHRPSCCGAHRFPASCPISVCVVFAMTASVSGKRPCQFTTLGPQREIPVMPAQCVPSLPCLAGAIMSCASLLSLPVVSFLVPWCSLAQINRYISHLFRFHVCSLCKTCVSVLAYTFNR